MILLAFAFAETLLVEVPVVFEVSGVDDGADGADPAVGVVEEAGDESGFEDLVIVETDIAELFNLLIVNVARMLPVYPFSMSKTVSQGYLHLRP